MSTWPSRITHLAKFGACAIVTMLLAGCVESSKPLITNARPLIGERFEVHLYENFVENKASYFHTAVYQWRDGQYLRASGLANDAKRFAAEPLAGSDFILQSTDDEGKRFVFWIGRKLSDGVYLIFALNAEDADEATRTANCSKETTDLCRIATHEHLVAMARAAAAKPVRDAALAVLVSK
jgi:hypothetical protein